MHLKQHLRKVLKQKISSLESSLLHSRNSLDNLERVNTNNADYTVSLTSLWEDHGEQSTKTEYKGKLEDAIKRAEEEFQRINFRRSDIQATYHVSINVNGNSYGVPQEYYNDFKKRKD